MTILVAGSSGFIGNALCSFLRNKGNKVKTLVRRASKDESEITWNPDNFEIPSHAFNDIDVVINLCGKNISDGLWSAKFKQDLFESRIKPTRTLARAITKLATQKLSLISMSGIGIYGAQTTEVVNEECSISSGFFSNLAQSWENEALSARSPIHRVAVIRLAVALGKNGGLINKISPVFKLGLGAKMGDGQNWMSWIAIQDICRAIDFIIRTESLSGPINLVNPVPYLGDDFYTDIGDAYNKPVVLRVPSFLLRLILGEFAEETILSNQQVAPKKLLDAGFTFNVKSPREAALLGAC